MRRLSDSELSLAVAKIILPQFKWHESRGCAARYINRSGKPPVRKPFSYAKDDALGKMCLWYANNVDELITRQMTNVHTVDSALIQDDPHLTIAEAIVALKHDPKGKQRKAKERIDDNNRDGVFDMCV